MVRTKQVLKGSRSSTRKRSTVSRCSTLSRTGSLSTTCDSDGFAVPAPVAPTLESLHKDLADQYRAMRLDYTGLCKAQKLLVRRNFTRLKVMHHGLLSTPIIELFADYQPSNTSKNTSSVAKTTMANSTVMQDRTNMQYSSKAVKPKNTTQTNNDVFKQPAKTRNSLRIQQQQQQQPSVASANKFITPMNTRPLPNMVAVTPKVNVNTPMSVIRRPRVGEFAMSITGSPLMVSAIPRDDMPSVCVPLPDGTVLSILPNSGISDDQLPFLDADLRAQLETLQSNLKFITGAM